MKVFVWASVKSLADYGDGEVVAFAETAKEAIELACKKGIDYLGGEPYEKWHPGLRRELETKEPDIYDGPFAWVDTGSA